MCRNTNENGCFRLKIIIEKTTSGLLDSVLGAELEPAEPQNANSRSVGAYKSTA